MLKVAIIDDDKKVGERLAVHIARNFKKNNIGWSVKHFFPLLEINEYDKWLAINKIIILIVDERLYIKANDNGDHIEYSGHDVVEKLRLRNKELPMYVVSAASTNKAEIMEMEGEFDGIFNRELFVNKKSSNPHIKRMVRSTQKYLDNFQSEYNRLAELSEKIALDNVTVEEVEELKGLQAKLNIPLAGLEIYDRKSWLNELELKATTLNELSDRIKAYLNK